MNKHYKENMILNLAMYLSVSYMGATISEISEKYEISRRTAERWLEQVKENFDCIEQVMPDRQKRWKVRSKILPELIQMGFDDITVLKNIQADYESQNKLDTASYLADLIEKIKLAHAKKHSADILKIENDIEALMELEGYAVRQYPNFKVDSSLIATIREAILSSKKLKIIYQKQAQDAKNAAERTVLPLGILKSSKVYLIACDDKKDNRHLLPKSFVLSKIKSIKILNEYFDMPEDFNLKDYANKSFGIYQGEPLDVVLKFNSEAMEDAKNYHFHPTQELTENKNHLIVKFKASGDEAICWELFKWGDSVEILAPESLKKTYTSKLDKILRIYE